MNSCHEEGVRDRNRAGIEAADPALRVGSAWRKIIEKGFGIDRGGLEKVKKRREQMKSIEEVQAKSSKPDRGPRG